MLYTSNFNKKLSLHFWTAQFIIITTIRISCINRHDIKKWGVLSQPMMDSGGKAECWSRWSIEEALLVSEPPASPGNLCSQEMERALFWNPSCATYELSIDGEERLSPSHNMWLTQDFRWHSFTRNAKLMIHVCRDPMSPPPPPKKKGKKTNGLKAPRSNASMELFSGTISHFEK